MIEITQNHAAELLGIDHRTTRRRVNKACLQPTRRNGRQLLFNSAELLPVVLGAVDDCDGRLDLSQERAKLAKVQTQKYELELEVLRGKLVDVSAITEQFGAIVSSYRSVMISLPVRMVSAIEAADTLHEKEQAARAMLFEALDVLANAGRPA